MKVALTQGKFAIIDDADTHLLEGWSWQAVKRGDGLWYARGYRAGTWIYLHQLILPDAARIDHIDRDGLNDRRSNLRPCSAENNARNSRLLSSANKSGYRGVRWHPKWGWQAYSKRAGKQVHLGWFGSAEDAAWARDAWIVRECDAHSTINLPPILNPHLAHFQ